MQNGSSTARVVLLSAPDEASARALARELVEARLAACVNLLPGATSVFRWQAQVQVEPEVMLIVKTSAARLEALQARVLARHPYELPEFVALEATHVEPSYARWLESATEPVDSADPDAGEVVDEPALD